jgi:hypothetical protein
LIKDIGADMAALMKAISASKKHHRTADHPDRFYRPIRGAVHEIAFYHVDHKNHDQRINQQAGEL